MNNVMIKWIAIASKLIAALAAINLGLRPFGFDFLISEFMLNTMPQFIVPLHYIILIAGLITLAFCVAHMNRHCFCGKCSGKKSC